MKSTKSSYNRYKSLTNENYQSYKSTLVNIISTHYAKFESFRLAL